MGIEIKSKIIKRRSGKSAGKFVLRLEYFDAAKDKVTKIERLSDKKSTLIDLRNTLEAKLKTTAGGYLTGSKMTFSDLVARFRDTIYCDAVIKEGRKVAGVRSKRTVETQLKHLEAFLGKIPITDITKNRLTEYKLWRLKQIAKRTGEEVKISTTNRELSVARRLLNEALENGWIEKPVKMKGLIDKSAETARTRILTVSEELELLDACAGEREVTYKRVRNGKTETITAKTEVNNPHLKALIVLAVDSAMRLGELLRLRWSDIDFVTGKVEVLGTHTKTLKARTVPLSLRAAQHLLDVQEFSPKDKVFPFTTIKRSFTTAKRIAKIKDLVFHDLRRTAISRWISQGTPLEIAGEIAGHSEWRTTRRHYIEATVDNVKDTAARIDAYNQDLHEEQSLQSTYNN